MASFYTSTIKVNDIPMDPAGVAAQFAPLFSAFQTGTGRCGTSLSTATTLRCTSRSRVRTAGLFRQPKNMVVFASATSSAGRRTICRNLRRPCKIESKQPSAKYHLAQTQTAALSSGYAGRWTNFCFSVFARRQEIPKLCGSSAFSTGLTLLNNLDRAKLDLRESDVVRQLMD